MFKLLWSNFATRRVRSLLTAAAIALSVSLIVAVTSGYASVETAALAYLNRYLGSADATITRPGTLMDGTVPQQLMVYLFHDPDVHRYTGRLEISSDLADKDDKPIEKSTFHIIGIARPNDSRINSLVLEAGQWFEHSDGDVAVVDQVAAAALKVSLGDSFSLLSDQAGQSRLRLKVVGIVHKPEILAAASKTIYVPLQTLQHFEHLDDQLTQIAIDFKPGADPAEFSQRWTPRLDQIAADQARESGTPIAPIKLRLVNQDRATMDLNLRSVHILSYLGGAVSMLAATFIIFSSLAMGINERQRTLAMLRAIGATRGQIAVMVVWEGILITLLGAAIGVPLGIFWTQCLQFLFRDLFPTGVTISFTGISLAFAGAMVSALAASILPAWSASRLSPLEAMIPLAETVPDRPPLRYAAVGLILIALDPLIFYAPWEKLVALIRHSQNPDALANLLRFYVHYALGVEALFLGFFFVSPTLVWIVEQLMSGSVGRLLGLPRSLLRQQLSHGLWRAAGAAAALMVGLSVLIVMTTQGLSMLNGWKLPDKFPDIFLVSLKLGGLNPDQIEQLGHTPGIRHFPDGSPELVPLAVTVSGLGSNPLALMGAVLAPSVNSTMFFGLPPRVAFQMMGLDFRDNDGRQVPPDQQAIYAQRAEQGLEQGRNVIVTEDYRRLHHVKYGDTVTFYGESAGLLSKPPEYQYKICGIIWSPGLDVIVAMFDLGKQMDQRTAGMVFGSLDDARRDFNAANVNLFAANLDTDVDKKDLLKNLRDRLGELNIKAGDVRQIKAAIDTDFRRLLMLLTTVAFSAMGIASMGVTNTIMTSIRSRRWQLGILRGIGLCAGELLRLVLAEALLLGFVGLALGLGCGAVLAADARQFGGQMLGYLPPLVIPWGYISIGCAGVMLVSMAAALWPAITVARTEPLALLQAGRAST
jgi:putative ABC transport system permease protein